MKGFPNQVSDLTKLATGIYCLVQLVDNRQEAKNDKVFGVALVRAGVAGTGHRPQPVEQYIENQLAKKPSNQSFRATARGLRELYRLMGFIDDSGFQVSINDLGRRAAGFAGRSMDYRQIEFWREVIRGIEHGDAHGVSHPYQVLLRLVAQKPGITRAKCALALEARNDSPEELTRIVELVDLPEDEIRVRIGTTKSNWDNAKKVLPSFAEQLGDVIRSSHSYTLSNAPGRSDLGVEHANPDLLIRGDQAVGRTPVTARSVTAETIGRAGTIEAMEIDETQFPELDPVAAARAIELRQDRLRRHNLLVQQLAARFQEAEARLFENPFDILALFRDHAVLVEVKTLDGTVPDERDRVRHALGQLLYYEAFVMPTDATGYSIRKVACFESEITQEHSGWLQDQGVGAIWLVENHFDGNSLSRRFLHECLLEFQ